MFVLSKEVRSCHHRAMLLTSGDIARAVDMSLDTVTRWERTGRIPKGARAGARGCRRWEASVIAPILLGWGYKVPASWGVGAAVDAEVAA